MAYESTTFEAETEMAAENLKDQAQTVMQRARERGMEKIQDTADLVRRHPGKTVAVSVVLGGIVGAMIVRALAKDEQTRMDMLAGLGADAWEKVRDSAEAAVCAAREAVDSALARFR